MSRIAKILMCFSSVAITAAATGQDLSGRPNILLFMVDDMGWQDTSVKFTPQRTDNNCKYTTPHMERLAGAWYLLRLTHVLSALPHDAACSPG